MGYKAIVYIDDYAGCEIPDKSQAAFDALGDLLSTLGLQEASDKSCPPVHHYGVPRYPI